MADDDLVSRALAARPHAYAPYSRYRVGAAVRVADGAIFTGVNVENASYGLTICAERAAIFAAVAVGHRVITHVAVATEGSPPAAPCGACLQVIREFGPHALVISVNVAGERWEASLRDLIPRSFGPEQLGYS